MGANRSGPLVQGREIDQARTVFVGDGELVALTAVTTPDFSTADLAVAECSVAT